MGRGAAGPSWTETIWRFDSDEPKTTSIEEHLTNLKAQFSPKELQLLLPLDCKLTIDIVVFFDTVNVSNQIPRSCFPIIDAYDAAIEITCYPTDFKRNE